MKTDSNVDHKKTVVAGKKEAYSSDAEVMLDPVSKAGVLSYYDAQWPQKPHVPSSSKTSITGDNPNVHDNHDAEDDGKYYNIENVGDDPNGVVDEDEVDGDDEVNDKYDDEDE
jgi:hypothetical protein